MVEYLVESALLLHGIAGISEQKLMEVWPGSDERIVWMENGETIIGNVQTFCSFRRKTDTTLRINYLNYDDCEKEKKTGALTASGTMRACEKYGISTAITCGIGGLRWNQDKEQCNDIVALMQSDVRLIATAPKDMFQQVYTIEKMKEAGIMVYGYLYPWCNGYLFVGDNAELTGVAPKKIEHLGGLYLRGIPEEKRIADKRILEEACRYGEEQRLKGCSYHPAVNFYIDKLSRGESSKIQLFSLVENIRWAESMKKSV